MHHGPLSKNLARGLVELRKRIDAAKIPASKLDETLLLATWNVRELGKTARRPESLHYIAEIIGNFDVVCLVEVRDDVTDLGTIMKYLGPYWRVVFSDYLADPGGNRERVAFLYDQRAASFSGLASHGEAPRKRKGSEFVDEISWWRPPYMASFQAGNFDFVVLGAHIRWGASIPQRERELQKLADWIADREDERFILDKDVIVVGDFNIPNMTSSLAKAIVSRGLQMPSALMGVHGSDLEQKKRYDQILHSPKFKGSFTGRAGVLDFYCGSFAPLFPGKRLSRLQGTFQLSDHLPLWIELNTDDDGCKLEQIVNPQRAAARSAR